MRDLCVGGLGLRTRRGTNLKGRDVGEVETVARCVGGLGLSEAPYTDY